MGFWKIPWDGCFSWHVAYIEEIPLRGNMEFTWLVVPVSPGGKT
jgi:hypothetical protein